MLPVGWQHGSNKVALQVKCLKSLSLEISSCLRLSFGDRSSAFGLANTKAWLSSEPIFPTRGRLSVCSRWPKDCVRMRKER